MGKDWLVWALCCALFASGIVFSKIVPGQLGLTDFIGMISALGTLAAAIAAWQSAKISAQMAAGSRSSERLSNLAEHRKQFDEMLTQTERDLGVVFYDRVNLYDRVFPTNRNPLLQFKVEGDLKRLEGWKKSYFSIIEYLRHPGDLLIERWVFAVMNLTGEICVRNVSVETEQVYISGYTPSGFNEENVSRYMGNLCSVLGRISNFGMIDANLHLMAESSRFEDAFEKFVIQVKSGMTQHSFRSTSKSTI
ncbi:hypothetical protein [Pseudomonas sp. NPDC086251]|uniref:hypothetical protein n=1 Tax=Pseudomonas sp. NPDC086251 TaxID=3364431 RepID=UPI0038383A71